MGRVWEWEMGNGNWEMRWESQPARQHAWNHPALLETCIARKGQTVEELRAENAAMAEFVLRALRPS